MAGRYEGEDATVGLKFDVQGGERVGEKRQPATQT